MAGGILVFMTANEAANSKDYFFLQLLTPPYPLTFQNGDFLFSETFYAEIAYFSLYSWQFQCRTPTH